MRHDVHRAALRATAKLAFSAFVVGCGGTAAPEEILTLSDPTPGESAQRAPSDARGKPRSPKALATDPGAYDAGAYADTGAVDAAPDCNALVAAAFPAPSAYPGTKKDVSREVIACCDQQLASMGPDRELAARWDCCANTDSTSEVVMLACTPWGPPVPPRMRPVARVSVLLGVA